MLGCLEEKTSFQCEKAKSKLMLLFKVEEEAKYLAR